MRPASKSSTGRHVSRWVCKSCQLRLSRGKSIRGFASIPIHSRKAKLPEVPARTRFAPSPTGNLHLGSIRTALFNYLLARRTGGQFLLRIEDTDQKRTVAGAEERLYEDLKWSGLHWDEGPLNGGPFGPYRQSERLFLYNTHIQTLLKDRKAYRCFCSAERIDHLNKLRHEKGLSLGYDRKCIDIPVEEGETRAANGEMHVVRFQIPKEYPKYDDLVYGKSGHGDAKNKQHMYDEPVFDDPVLIKSDGFPTYHFANVVDDQLMQITHVIRGSEWMSSTPLHMALYDAFGWQAPQYGHVPLLVDANRQKLSKRNFDSDISSFRDKRGIFPESLTNFAALLGWSHQQKSDIMDLLELEKVFDLKITKGNTIVAFEKLAFLQEHHARRRIQTRGEEFEQMIRDVAVILLDQYGAAMITKFIGKRKLRDVIASMLETDSLPYQNPQQFVASLGIFFKGDKELQRSDLRAVLTDLSTLPSLRIAATALMLPSADTWTRQVHRVNLAQLQIVDDTVMSDEEKASARKAAKRGLYGYMRWALLGGAQGPSIPDTMEILGREICERRMKEAYLLARECENERTHTRLKGSTFEAHLHE